MKKFSVNCDFGGQVSAFSVYIGVPEGSHHPLHFQSDWLGKNRGGSILPEVMESIGRLKEIADKNGVLLEDLCVYALGAAQQELDEEQNPEASEELSLDDEILEDQSEDYGDMVFSPGKSGDNDDLTAITDSDEDKDEDDSYLDELFSDDVDFNGEEKKDSK